MIGSVSPIGNILFRYDGFVHILGIMGLVVLKEQFRGCFIVFPNNGRLGWVTIMDHSQGQIDLPYRLRFGTIIDDIGRTCRRRIAAPAADLVLDPIMDGTDTRKNTRKVNGSTPLAYSSRKQSYSLGEAR